jgi:hypothetical protein
MALVACAQIPAFAIAVARRDDTVLAVGPLMLCTPDRQRPMVYAALGDAGVPASVTLRQARMRCPRAVYRMAEPERDLHVFDALVTLLHSSARGWRRVNCCRTRRSSWAWDG